AFLYLVLLVLCCVSPFPRFSIREAAQGSNVPVWIRVHSRRQLVYAFCCVATVEASSAEGIYHECRRVSFVFCGVHDSDFLYGLVVLPPSTPASVMPRRSNEARRLYSSRPVYVN